MESPETLVHAAAERRDPAPPRATGRIPGPSQVPAGELLLGRYRLLRRLGAGGFGEVWSARDELLQRDVAVKRIRLGPDGDSERAAREALASARLAHPAIVALFEACAAEGSYYLISELVEGDTLAQLIAEDALEDEEILEIGVALLEALGHAHARGVIHRDIKPQNVLVPGSDGESAPAKLTDFGGASLLGEEGLTRTGDVLGTLAYMAPEQSEGREVAEEADLYSLALVLYEALAGVHPVRGATPAATARRIGRRLEPLERHRPDLPRSLTRALDTALDPSPARRGTLEQLRRALEHARETGQAPHPAVAPRLRAARLAPAQGVRPPIEARPPRSPQIAEALTPALEPAAARPPHRLALPRMLWLAGALLVIGWQAASGRPGVSILLAAAALPLLALPRRAGPAWVAAALAPALGLSGLAGAYPALSGQASRWRTRAALGALGYWWLLLAEPLLATRLWLGPPGGTPPRGAWEASLSTSAVHVLGPLLSTAALLGALLWALAALLLPCVVRGRNAALDILAATVWSAALVTAAPLLDSGIGAAVAHPSPRGAVLGAVLGGALAVAARALRGPV